MTSSFELLVSLVAGLGLHFGGNKLLGDNIRVLIGRQFRDLLPRLSAVPFTAGLFGILSGFVTWNSRTATYIVAGFVHSRLIPLQQGMPIVLWANAGCSLLVFAAVLPLKYLVLLLLGFSGIFLNLEAPHRFRNAYGAIFGLSLLLLGLTLIKTSAAGLVTNAWFQSLLVLIKESPGLSFLMGLLLTVLAQSHLSITLIAIALTESDLLTVNSAFMIVLGAHAGNSANTYLLGWRFTGSARQVIMTQVLGTLIGVVLFVAAFTEEQFGYFPSLKAAMAWVTDDSDRQAACMTILFNFAVPAVLVFFAGPYQRLIGRFWSPSEQESLSHPEYIQAYGGQPETAALLAEQEQRRLLKRLPAYLDELRRGNGPKQGPGAEAYHAAFGSISEQLLEFLLHVLQGNVALETSARLLNLQNRQKLIETIEADVFGLFRILRGRTGQGKAEQLGLSIVESLDTLLLTAVAAVETGDPDERDLLSVLTSDRGEMMERIRKSYLSVEHDLSSDDRSLILYVTHLFERTAWSIGQYGRLLASAAA